MAGIKFDGPQLLRHHGYTPVSLLSSEGMLTADIQFNIGVLNTASDSASKSCISELQPNVNQKGDSNNVKRNDQRPAYHLLHLTPAEATSLTSVVATLWPFLEWLLHSGAVGRWQIRLR